MGLGLALGADGGGRPGAVETVRPTLIGCCVCCTADTTLGKAARVFTSNVYPKA
jgi:hypothetical protein